MDTWLLLNRLIAFSILFLTLIYSRRLNGSSVNSIPYWITFGVLFLYSSYCFSGISFYNGISIQAELVLAFLPLIGAIGFSLPTRARIKDHYIVNLTTNDYVKEIPKVSGFFLLFTTFVTLLFFYTLTNGQPWRIITDGVDLKWDRLSATLQDKNPLLVVFDALSYALIMIGISWSIIGYKDDKRSRNALVFLIILIALYILSTGSRTPIIGVILQILGSVFFGQQNSQLFSKLYYSRIIIWAVAILTILFMIIVTNFRIQAEDLDIYVFIAYFDIVEIGIIEQISKYGSIGFFLSTIITYAASTYNNAVIRIQEINAIYPTFGYKFMFYYLYVLANRNAGIFGEWRDLATVNNEHLLAISDSATQWAMIYGDAIWDFGIGTTALLVFFVSYVSGVAIRRASIEPTLSSQLLGATIVGFSLSPLVNPFLSLHVHLMLFIIYILFLVNISQPRSYKQAM